MQENRKKLWENDDETREKWPKTDYSKANKQKKNELEKWMNEKKIRKTNPRIRNEYFDAAFLPVTILKKTINDNQFF